MTTIEQGGIIIPSDPHVRKEIKDAVRDISDQWVMKKSYDDKVKEIIDATAEKYDLPKEYVRKLADIYHKQAFKKEQTKTEDIFALYEAVIGDN